MLIDDVIEKYNKEHKTNWEVVKSIESYIEKVLSGYDTYYNEPFGIFASKPKKKCNCSIDILMSIGCQCKGE